MRGAPLVQSWRGALSLWRSAVLGTWLLACSACFEQRQREAGQVAAREPAPSTAGEPAPAPAQAPAVPARAEAAPLSGAARAPVRRELTWSFENGPFGPTDVVISVPTPGRPGERFPVLVAFHGRGESHKGNRRGARAWFDDYAIVEAMTRLAQPPLRSEDFAGFVAPERLRRVNVALREKRYAGLILVCPYLPDVLRGSAAFTEAEPLSRFVVDVLLPRVYAKTPAIGTPATTGVDGVSLGGRAALFVGLTRPLAFGAVGSLQAALDMAEISRIADLAARALATNPKLTLRVLTSDEDYFLDVNQELARALRARRVPHEFARVLGTHSYRFNRGPGALEMLLFHDRVLRGQAPP